MYGAVAQQMEEDADLVVVRHEDLALSPQDEFARLFHTLGLRWTPTVTKRLEPYTAGHRPDEAGDWAVTMICDVTALPASLPGGAA